jgi:hypothetical protein
MAKQQHFLVYETSIPHEAQQAEMNVTTESA